MSINQLIAAGIQLPRFESPMNMMAQLSQLESAREANELRRMQMAQMQRQQEQEMELMNALQSGQPLSFQQAARGGRTGLSAFELQQGQLEAQRKRAEAQQLERAVPFAVAARRAVNTPVESPEESDALLMGARQELADLGISSPEIDQRFASLQLLGTPEARREGLVTLVSSIPGLEQTLAARQKEAAGIGKTEAETRKLNLEAGQVGRPQQFAPPEILRLMEARDATPPGSPARAELQRRIDAIGTPSGTTIQMPPGEKAEQAALGTQRVDDSAKVSTAADSARRQLVSLQSIQRVLSDNDFKTGFGTETKAKAASFFAALGVPNAERYATSAQTFLQGIKENTLTKLSEQKGVQTNQDADRIEQTAAQLGNTPAANRFMVTLARAVANRSIEQEQFYSEWLSKNKTLEGARQAWLAKEGNNSIFDRPEMSSYAPQQRGSAGGESQPGAEAAPVTIKSDADYNALPSGALYISPNGDVRRKR